MIWGYCFIVLFLQKLCVMTLNLYTRRKKLFQCSANSKSNSTNNVNLMKHFVFKRTDALKLHILHQLSLNLDHIHFKKAITESYCWIMIMSCYKLLTTDVWKVIQKLFLKIYSATKQSAEKKDSTADKFSFSHQQRCIIKCWKMLVPLELTVYQC